MAHFQYYWCEPLYRVAIKQELKKKNILFDITETTEQLEERYNESLKLRV